MYMSLVIRRPLLHRGTSSCHGQITPEAYPSPVLVISWIVVTALAYARLQCFCFSILCNLALPAYPAIFNRAAAEIAFARGEVIGGERSRLLTESSTPVWVAGGPACDAEVATTVLVSWLGFAYRVLDCVNEARQLIGEEIDTFTMQVSQTGMEQ